MEADKYIKELVTERLIGLKTGLEIIKKLCSDVDCKEYEEEKRVLTQWLLKTK